MHPREYRLALIGWPVKHSVSPAMQNAAMKAAGVSGQYDAVPVRPGSVTEFLEQMRHGTWHGANVTVPHKQAVLPYMDDLSETASRLGAVNTIVREGKKLIGYNTDVGGLIDDLTDHEVDTSGKRVLLLGAGGAAHAVIDALSAAFLIYVANRTKQRAEQLVGMMSHDDSEKGPSLRVMDWKQRGLLLSDVDLVINATTLGMSPDVNRSPLEDDVSWTPQHVVYDLIYNPRRTKLLQSADKAGARAIGGLGMLVHQGARALELWVPDIEADRSVMLKAAEEGLQPV